mgnify:CR=1 FL=1
MLGGVSESDAVRFKICPHNIGLLKERVDVSTHAFASSHKEQYNYLSLLTTPICYVCVFHYWHLQSRQYTDLTHNP